MSATTQMVKIPSNVNILGWKDKSTPIVQNKSRRSRFKTPLAVRKKMAAARKKLKLPVAALAVTLGPPIIAIADGLSEPRRARYKIIKIGTNLLEWYTGFRVNWQGTYLGWDWKKPAIAYGGLAALAADSKYVGARRYANTILGNANIPIMRV